MANRFMKFYPSDWRSEKRLRLISRAARSLWIDMIGLMFDEGTGRLEVEGKPMTIKQLSDTLGDNARTTKRLLAEIEGMGVSSRDKDGFIVSRRIVRDFEKAEQDKSNGRRGGNPALKPRGNGCSGVNPKDKTQKPEAIFQIEEDKSSSIQEGENYQEYLKAHPKPVDSGAGRLLFSDLVESGVDPEQIIDSAKAYAETVKCWSGEGKVQQSDNFLDPERGKWKSHISKPKAVRASHDEILSFWAERINGTGHVASSSVNPGVARALIESGLVTPEKLKERGIAA